MLNSLYSTALHVNKTKLILIMGKDLEIIVNLLRGYALSSNSFDDARLSVSGDGSYDMNHVYDITTGIK